MMQGYSSMDDYNGNDYIDAIQMGWIGEIDGDLENFVGMPEDDFGWCLDCWLEFQQVERDGWFSTDLITDPRYRQWVK